jgi:SHS2 domain-containing protein
MPFRYLEDIAIADVAFEAWGATLEEMFVAAAEATLNAMVSDLNSIEPCELRRFEFEPTPIDLQLYKLLQELIYYKDAENLLLRITALRLQSLHEGFAASVEARGEMIDGAKHELLVDVKAVTFHRFKVEATPLGWGAVVVLDV